ncbi:MAG: hypothetical protein JWL77_5325 [Chthonomonadaceae bacterium]|nr:hypothetical protein [Chthonomonadaceae bacterium]
MGPGLKYHVITVAAIFFALTIGLVVGSLIVSPGVADRQGRAITRLQTTLNQDNISLRQKLKRWEDFGGRVSPVLLKGRLFGAQVCVIQTGDYPDATARVRETLQLADARIPIVLTMGRAYDRPDEVLNPALASLHTANPLLPADRTAVAEALATAIEQGTPKPAELFPRLEEAQILHAEVDNARQTPIRIVVLVAGSRAENDTRPAQVDQPLIEALQRHGLTVVMCEPQEVISSDSENYRKLGLNVPTIVGIDSDIGRCDLILALGGTP